MPDLPGRGIARRASWGSLEGQPARVAPGLHSFRRRLGGADADVLLHPSATQPHRARQQRPGDQPRVRRRRAGPRAVGGRGPPYVVEFFEGGCAHCPQVAGQLCNEKVPVFAVDAAKESAMTITAFRRQYAAGCSYPSLLDPTFSAVMAYAVSVVPTVYVVKLGRIVFAGAGLDGMTTLPSAVQKAISG